MVVSRCVDQKLVLGENEARCGLWVLMLNGGMEKDRALETKENSPETKMVGVSFVVDDETGG